MKTIVVDPGNGIIKAKIAGGEEVAFPHALKEITEAKYQSVIKRSNGTPPLDYMRINGKPYVTGESAEREGLISKRSGAARYTPDYSGVLVAASLGRLYSVGGQTAVFVSHAPGDIDYRDNLIDSVLGDWHIEAAGRTLWFSVEVANSFDEPQGGLMNVVLTEDGTHYQRSDVNQGTSLVIDIGSLTTDWLAVKPGGEVDYSLHISSQIGISKIVEDFERSFRASHRELAQSTSQLPPAQVREAIVTGCFQGAGDSFPCEIEVNEAVSMALNNIADNYQRVAGGALPWQSIILTGGGSALLYERLLPILKHKRVILAGERDTIHMANVRGGLKLWRLYESLGLV